MINTRTTSIASFDQMVSARLLPFFHATPGLRPIRDCDCGHCVADRVAAMFRLQLADSLFSSID